MEQITPPVIQRTANYPKGLCQACGWPGMSGFNGPKMDQVVAIRIGHVSHSTVIRLCPSCRKFLEKVLRDFGKVLRDADPDPLPPLDEDFQETLDRG